MSFNLRIAPTARIFIGFFISLFIIIAIAVLYYLQLKDFSQKELEAERAYSRILKLEKIFSILKEAESSQRGYFISRDTTFIASLNNSINEAKIQKSALFAEPILYDKATYSAIEKLILKKIELLRSSKTLIANKKTHELQYLVSSKLSQGLLDTLSFHINSLSKQEEDRYNELKSQSSLQSNKMFLLLILAGLLMVIIILYHFISTLRDINGTIKLKDEIAEKNQYLSSAHIQLNSLYAILSEAQKLAQLGVWEWNLATNEIYWSEELYRLYGFVPGQVEPSFELMQEKIPQDQFENLLTKANQITIDLKPYEYDHQIIFSDGTEKKIYGRAKAIADQTGKPVKVTGISWDITTVINTQQKLFESEERYKLLADNSSDVISVYTKEGICTYISPSCYQVYGYTPEEMTGKKSLDLIHPEDIESFNGNNENLYNNDVPLRYKYRLRKKNGEYVWMESIAKVIRKPLTSEIMEVHVSSRNITELKELNEALEQKVKERTRKLEESETEFRLLASAATELIWTTNAKGEIDDLPKWREYTGQTKDELKGFGWLKAIHPDDQDKTMQTWQNAIQEKSLFEAVYRLKDKKGQYRYFLSRGLPLLDHMGEIKKWIGMMYDVHERIEHEEKLKIAYREVSEQNEKLRKINEVLDTFVYAAAHDLKSPVHNIKILIDLINTTHNPEERKQFEDALKISVSRLENTITGLAEVINVENITNQTIAEINFNDMVNRIKQELNVELQNSGVLINSDFCICDHISYIEPYLHSIFLNLISNAIKYRQLRKKTEINIKTTLENQFVVLYISDNGIGMDLSKTGNKLFKPFSRLTHQAQGRGIGLYLIKTMVEKNGGKIEVESKEGVGTTFKVFLKKYSTI